jgi:hypothetical protein
MAELELDLPSTDESFMEWIWIQVHNKRVVTITPEADANNTVIGLRGESVSVYTCPRSPRWINDMLWDESTFGRKMLDIGLDLAGQGD